MAGRRIEGPTVHGGAYAIMYERDGKVEIVEHDEKGEAIFRTYGNKRQGKRAKAQEE